MYVGGMNNRIQVVGHGHGEGDSNHVFLWRKGEIEDLYESSGWYGQALDINEKGQAVGISFPSWRAVLWEAGNLEILPDLRMAYGINNAGHIVGITRTTPYRALLYEKGIVRELGSLGSGHSYAYDINERGQVVGGSGGHAFLWERGRGMVDLGTLAGWESEAVAINNRGHVVGRSRMGPSSGSPQHPFLWTKSGMRDLGTLADPTVSAYARGINDRDQVVGGSRTASGRWHAFLWEKGTMFDLGCLPGGNSCEAWDISESGVIAGFSEDADGDHVGVLWMPKNLK
jgi:probable HAF family extracellular repeat protein